MSAALVPPLEDFAGKRFTREEVERLEQTGALDGLLYELIDGELISRMGQNYPHSFAIRRIMAAFVKLFEPIFVQIQLPIEVAPKDRPRNFPVPDVSVLAGTESDKERRIADGLEVVVAIEVADATLKMDMKR